MAKLSSINEALDFESMFGSDDFKRNKIVSHSEPKQKPYVLELYRGFDVDIDELEREGSYFILSPEKSEQGLIWFTHNLIQAYDPVEYVRDRGSHILTYPLDVIRHYQDIGWSDGTTSRSTPPEIDELTVPTENCQFHMGIELPEGWVFSYKMEKFIGCSIRLKISSDMLNRQ